MRSWRKRWERERAGEIRDSMRPTQFNNDPYHIGICPSPLKINKESYFIKKSSPPSSSSSSSASSLANGISATAVAAKPQQRHPVIIYTHSPKIIHTHPCDFKALVQKLTGISRSDENDQPPLRPKQEPAGGGGEASEEELIHRNQNAASGGDDNDSSSVITDENCSSASVVGNVQINSCFGNPSHPPPPPPIFDPPINPNCFNNIPLFSTNPGDFLCPGAHQPFYSNYADSLLLVPNMRSSSISSSPILEGMKEFREF